MFSSYKVFPMRADGDIYALYDPKGNQVAMGTQEVCQTLLYLVTHSSLMEKPPRNNERVAPKPRVILEAAPAEGGAGSEVYSEAGVRPLGGSRSGGAADGIKLSAPVLRLGGYPTSPFSATPYGVFDLIWIGSRSAAAHWYVSLFVVIMIVSALLTWALLSP